MLPPAGPGHTSRGQAAGRHPAGFFHIYSPEFRPTIQRKHSRPQLSRIHVCTAFFQGGSRRSGVLLLGRKPSPHVRKQ